MLKRIVAIFVFSVWTSGVNAQEPEYVTSRPSLVCLRFTDIQEAIKAAADEKWLLSLHCRMVDEGIPVIKIDELAAVEYGNPWKVRMKLPNGDGITLWGPVFSFKPAKEPPKK